MTVQVQSEPSIDDRIWSIMTNSPLTPEELRATRIPDKSLERVQIEFTSIAGNHYGAIYFGPDEHYTVRYVGTPRPFMFSNWLQLFTYDGNREDFSLVRQIMRRVSQARFQLAPFITEYSPRHIITDIPFTGELTQARVSDIVEELTRDFRDVTISEVIFVDVPRATNENLGLPLEKLTIVYSRKLTIVYSGIKPREQPRGTQQLSLF